MERGIKIFMPSKGTKRYFFMLNKEEKTFSCYSMPSTHRYSHILRTLANIVSYSWKGQNSPPWNRSKTKARNYWNFFFIFSSVKTLVPLWEKYWSAARKDNKAQGKIFWVLVQCFWPTFLLGALYQLIYVLLLFASPQILGLIISFVESDEEPMWKGYFYTLLFFIVAFISAVSDSSYWYNMRIVGLRLRTSLSSTIYKKSLKLSNASRKAQTGNFWMNETIKVKVTFLFQLGKSSI